MSTEIQAVGIDVEAIMADALLEPIGSQKAYYVNQLITALGANPKIRFSRDGTPVYADVASTVLQHVSGNLKFPANWGGSPSPHLAADIDTGTWIAEIEKAADSGVKLLLTAGPVGSDTHMRIDRDLDGSSLITPGDMLFAAPASLDVGAPPVGDPNLLVDTVIDDMGLLNDDAAFGNNSWWSRNPPPGIGNAFNAWGTNWDAAVQAEWFANQDWVQSIIQGGTRYWRYLLPWFVPYIGDTHAGSNHAVRFWKFKLFARRRSDGGWVMLRSDDAGSSTGWSRATLGAAIATGQPIDVEYGPSAVKMRCLNIFNPAEVPANQQFVHHGWWSSPQYMDETQYDLIIHAVLASLELWNPQGEDNRDQASIVLAMGGDTYPSATWRPGAGRIVPAFCHSRLKKVRVQPTWHTCATLLNCYQDHRGPTAGASVSSLRLNPWPFLI